MGAVPDLRLRDQLPAPVPGLTTFARYRVTNWRLRDQILTQYLATLTAFGHTVSLVRRLVKICPESGLQGWCRRTVTALVCLACLNFVPSTTSSWLEQDRPVPSSLKPSPLYSLRRRSWSSNPGRTSTPPHRLGASRQTQPISSWPNLMADVNNPHKPLPANPLFGRAKLKCPGQTPPGRLRHPDGWCF